MMTGSRAAERHPRLNVYLAGPDVFLQNAKEVGEQKKEICARYGFEGVFPLDQAPEEGLQPREMAVAIFEICLTMMNACQLAIANMTPFRGVSMDVGTAVEIGYMCAQNKPVFGYTNVIDDYKARVQAAKRDCGFEVEDFGLVDNLMCEGVVQASGGEVVRNSVDAESRLTNLTGFEECVRRAFHVLGPNSPTASF